MSKLKLKREDRDKIAAVLSVLPGAGHLYKHHYLDGLAILFVGNFMMLFVAIWLAFATLGLSLLVVPAVYVLGVGFSAYSIEDWHGKHT